MATEYKIIILLVSLTLVATGCNRPDSHSETSVYSSSEFNKLVEMHCRARMLKNERFELADNIRKSQASRDLKNLDSLKQVKGAQSRALADSIAKVIEHLSGEMTPEEKRTFNDSIEDRIARMNCEN